MTARLSQRMLPALVGLALLFLLLFVFTFRNLLLFGLFAVVISALGAREMAQMLRHSSLRFTPINGIALVLGIVLPGAELVTLQFGIAPATQITITAFALLLLGGQALRRRKIGRSPAQSAGALLLLAYPGLFVVYGIRMTSLADANLLLAVMLGIVVVNDTVAYICGRLARGRTAGVVAVSMNKTIIGFAGGIGCATLFVPLVAGSITPLQNAPFYYTFILGFGVAVAATFGDLAESAIKRAVANKDSGNLVPGRGGILDSVDSHLFAAPVFYWLYNFLYVS